MAFTLDAMSIYGQDTRILDSWYSRQDGKPKVTMASPRESAPQDGLPTRCFFLDLPLELRQQIYDYVLPRTFDDPINGVVWHRGSTALLATNSKLHEETSQDLYGNNTFAVDVIYDCATFDYKWILPNGLVPKRRLAFPEQIGNGYIQLLRRIHVKVHHLDQYTGMIKYNYSGPGLTNGLRQQVMFLCRCLASVPKIRHLSVVLKDDTDTPEIGRKVLEPFLELKNIRAGDVGGNIEPAFAQMLASWLNPNMTETTPSLSDLPVEIRREIYQNLWGFVQPLDQDQCKSKTKQTSGWRQSMTSLVSLSYTNRAFYTEIQTFMFSRGRFELRITQNLAYEFGLKRAGSIVTSRAKPVALFPQGIYVPGFGKIRRLSIHVAHVSLSLQSAQCTELEAFFDDLVRCLETAPLKCLTVEYASNKKYSSGDSPISRDPMTSYVRSLDTNTQTIDNSAGARPLGLNHHGGTSSIADTNYGPSITSSPTTMIGFSQISSSLLQTPSMSYLVAKFNPIMARIKTQEDGTGSFYQYSVPETQPRYISNNSSPIRSPDMAEKELASIDLSQSPASIIRQGSRSRTPSSTRSSEPSQLRIKRNRKHDLLFQNVPL